MDEGLLPSLEYRYQMRMDCGEARCVTAAETMAGYHRKQGCEVVLNFHQRDMGLDVDGEGDGNGDSVLYVFHGEGEAVYISDMHNDTIDVCHNNVISWCERVHD